MQLAFQLIQRVFSAVEVRALSRPLESFQTNLGKHLSLWTSLYLQELACWNKFRPLIYSTLSKGES